MHKIMIYDILIWLELADDFETAYQKQTKEGCVCGNLFRMLYWTKAA
jgi:hypothetical protein